MKTVSFVLNDGRPRLGTLVKENPKTLVIYPYRWIKCKPITVHKVKNKAQVLA